MTDHEPSPSPPVYPVSDDPSADRPPEPTASRGTQIVIIAVALIVVLIILLHLTGVVGPTSH